MDMHIPFTAYDLVELALADGATDFTGDLQGVGTVRDMTALAAVAIATVADPDLTPMDRMLDAIVELSRRGWEILERRALDERAEIIDAIDGGYVSRLGETIPWPRSPL